MAHGRMGLGVAFLLALAGTASAQPGALFPPGAPSPSPASELRSIAGTVDDHGAMKDLTPHGFGNIVPHDKHGKHGGGHGEGGHGGGHAEPGEFMTPFIPHHGGWYAEGEFLLMRPRNTDLDFVIRDADAGVSTNGPIGINKYGQGTGLRAEFGYRWGEGKWESAFAYTYVNAGGDTSFFANNGGQLLPTLTRPGLTDRALTATANVDLDYSLFDALVARRVLVDEHFGVRFIGGVRFSDIRQVQNAFYDGNDARRASVNTRSRFTGAGPIAGLESVLVGPMGFHFYSRGSIALLTGNSRNGLIETNDGGQTPYINTTYDLRKVVPMTAIAIGAGWQYRSIAIRGGYEITHMLGVFERPRFTDDVSAGKVITRPSNLSLEGFFFQMSFGF